MHNKAIECESGIPGNAVLLYGYAVAQEVTRRIKRRLREHLTTMHYALLVLAGAVLCNSLPHLAAGLQGMHFPSPFSKPPGEGDSSPLVNFLWGLFNLLTGWWIVATHPVSFGPNADFLSLLAGVVLLGVWISIHFGKVQGRKRGA